MTSLLTIPFMMALMGSAPDAAEPAEEDTATPAEAMPPGEAPDGTEPPGDPPADLTGEDTSSGDDETPSSQTPEDASDTSTEAAPLPTPARPAPPPTKSAVTPPPPPRPIRWRLDFGVGVGATRISDRGFLAFSQRRLLPEVTTSVLFDFRLAQSRFFLGGGLAYQRLGRDGGNAYGLGTELTMHEPEVLGRFSAMTIQGIDAFARVGVGPSVVRTDYYSGQNADQRQVLPRVDGQAGLSLYLPKQWLARKQAGRVTAGIELGVGYTWRGTIEARPVLMQEEEPLQATTSPWGDLSMHGLSWRMGLFVRVM